VPPDFSIFVLVDDEGRELRRGHPTGSLPSMRSRRGNYDLVRGGKYAVAADAISQGKPTESAFGPKVCDGVVDVNETPLTGA